MVGQAAAPADRPVEDIPAGLGRRRGQRGERPSQSLGLARRVVARASDGAARVNLALELTWSRPASREEMQTALRYVERYRYGLARSGVAGEAQEVQAWASLARVLLAANEFIYVD